MLEEMEVIKNNMIEQKIIHILVGTKTSCLYEFKKFISDLDIII